MKYYLFFIPGFILKLKITCCLPYLLAYFWWFPCFSSFQFSSIFIFVFAVDSLVITSCSLFFLSCQACRHSFLSKFVPLSPRCCASQRPWPISHTFSVQFNSVTHSCPMLCDPMEYSMPGLPVHHQLLMFTQTHVHWVSDAIQPFHSLLSPSLPAFNLSQHQGLFKWVNPWHQVAKVLEFQLQH